MKEQLLQELKSIKIINTALILAVLLFLIITIIINVFADGFDISLNDETRNMLLIAANIIGISAISAGSYFFNKKMTGITDKELDLKIQTYLSSMIIRTAAIEVSAFFFILVYLLTASTISLVEAIIVLAIMIFYFPTNERLSKEMKIKLRD